ncbi:hypothetical protein RFI_01916 [Reticulomyxa filosa]|uniref:Uncharacterized protein n=1 Tax=Reticulomyxa filosa TaxID=46433 RepID=X6PAJ8_RETFI|nr:hypothetical protein RFI_01916 [Reticulomyxa filosa]|eukprot:ETO35158.1 hypothetical protein RFI_01916 [Reticulomyxa filosa]
MSFAFGYQSDEKSNMSKEDIVLEDIQQLSLIADIYYVSEDLTERITDQLQKLFARNIDGLKGLRQREKKAYEEGMNRFAFHQTFAMESILGWNMDDSNDFDTDKSNVGTGKGFGKLYKTTSCFNHANPIVGEACYHLLSHLETLTEKLFAIWELRFKQLLLEIQFLLDCMETYVSRECKNSRIEFFEKGKQYLCKITNKNIDFNENILFKLSKQYALQRLKTTKIVG